MAGPRQQNELESPDGANVTGLLEAWADGDPRAFDALVPMIYPELQRLAHQYMSRERPGHTLQTTALINEAYLRLVDQKQVEFRNRSQFLGVAAQLMRRVLIDYARRRSYAKRGGGAHPVSFDDVAVLSPQQAEDVLALDEALERLASNDQRKARVVELRYFGGLTVDETAELLKVSSITVMREWSFAKSWLYRELSNDR